MMYAIFSTPAGGHGWQTVKEDQPAVPGEVGRQATQPPDPFVWDGTQARSPTESEALDVYDDFGVSPRQARKREIEAAYERQCDAGIDFEGHHYETEERSLNAMNRSRGVALSTGFAWRSSADVMVPMDATTLERLWEAIHARGWQLFQQRSALKDAVSGASTQAALDAVAVPAEWVT